MRLWQTRDRLRQPPLPGPIARARRGISVCDLARRYTQRQADLDSAREMAQDAGNDADLKAMADEEIIQAEADLTQLEAELQTALLPRDPDDARNAFVEIRAGTGGDESALFAADLARMYTRYAEIQAGAARSCRPASRTWAATSGKWCCALKVPGCMASSNSNRVATACSACP